MLFMVHAKLAQPAHMSNKEFYGLWLEEAEAAVGAKKAGVIKDLWKVAGKPEVYGVLDLESPDAVDEALQSLPIWKQGYSYVVTSIECTALRPYENWYEQLKSLAAD